MVYRWKNQSLGKVKAQIVGEEIERIAAHTGSIKPIDIVNAARCTTNPLHPCFEWNNKIAAEKYRQEQASYMLRQIVIVHEQHDEEPIMVRAFVSVRDEDASPVYKPIQTAHQNEEEWAYVISQAYDELQAWRNKYKTLQQFSQIFNSIDSLKIA